MNRGLMLKAAREMGPPTLLLGLGLLLVEGILAFVLPTFQQEIGEVLHRMALIQRFLKALLGTELPGEVGPDFLVALRWVHPVVLALLWAHAIICCTRVPAGEVDRGTVDILLSLPVSRWRLFFSESVVWLGSGIVLVAMALAGSALGSARVSADLRPSSARLAVVIVNLACLYLAVGGLTWLVSALSDRRGRAIAVVFAIVLASFLLNYLAQFWRPAQRLSFLSVLSYYRPMLILQDGAWPMKDLVVLGAAAAASWLSAGWVFSRRDLMSV